MGLYRDNGKEHGSYFSGLYKDFYSLLCTVEGYLNLLEASLASAPGRSMDGSTCYP